MLMAYAGIKFPKNYAGIRYPHDKPIHWDGPSVSVPVWREITVGQVLESVWDKLQAEGVEPFDEGVSQKAEKAWKEFHAARVGQLDRLMFPDVWNSIRDTEPCPVAVFTFIP